VGSAVHSRFLTVTEALPISPPGIEAVKGKAAFVLLVFKLDAHI
jgi:hypothetical protein